MSTNNTIVIDGTIGASEIAEKIIDAHKRARASAKTAIKAAIECGALLLQAKEGMGRGHFDAWITAECKFSRATAYNYMKAAKSSNALDGSSLRHLYESGRAPARKVPAITSDAEARTAMDKMQAMLTKASQPAKPTESVSANSRKGSGPARTDVEVAKAANSVIAMCDQPSRYRPETCWRWNQASPAMQQAALEVMADKVHVNARMYAVQMLMDLLDVSAEQMGWVATQGRR